MTAAFTPLTAAELSDLRGGIPIVVTVERLLCTVFDQADALALAGRQPCRPSATSGCGASLW